MVASYSGNIVVDPLVDGGFSRYSKSKRSINRKVAGCCVGILQQDNFPEGIKGIAR